MYSVKLINCSHVLWPVGFLMRMVCTSVVAALSDRRCTESSHHGYGVDLLQNMRKVTELICFTVTEWNDVMVKPHILSLLQRFWLITITKPAKCDDNEYGNPHIWSQNVAAINQFNTVHSTTVLVAPSSWKNTDSIGNGVRCMLSCLCFIFSYQ